MGVRLKIIIILSLLFVFGAGLLMLGFKAYLDRSFEDYHRSEAEAQLLRARQAWQQRKAALDLIVRDWANWDESYNFIRGLRKRYIKDNLNYATLKNIDLDICRYYDLEGRFIYQAIRTSDTVMISSSASFPELDSLLAIVGSGQARHLSGFLDSRRGLLLVSVWPVKRSDTSGPTAGFLAGAVFLNQERQQAVSDDIMSQVTIKQRNAPSLRKNDSGDSEIYLAEELSDIRNRPAFLLEVLVRKKLTGFKSQLFWMQVYLLLIYLAAVILGLYFLLERVVLNKIYRLHKWSRDITAMIDSDKAFREKMSGKGSQTAMGEKGRGRKKDELIELEQSLKDMVATLQEARIRYRILFDNMLNGFARHRIICDSQGKPVDYEFLEVNHAFEVLTGLTAGDIVGRRVSQVMPDLLREEFDWIAAYGRVAQEGQELRMERYCQALDRWFSIVAFQTDPGGFATVFEVISDRKKIQQKLEESETRFRQVAESTDLWVWEVDAQGIYTYSNSAVEKILGYQPEEIVGRLSYEDLFSPDGREELKAEARAIFQKRERFVDFYNPCRHKNGRTVILKTNGFPVCDGQGAFIGYRGMDEDVTEQQALAEERESIIFELQQALENIRTLRGLIPICANCKKVRNDQGYWQQVEEYVSQHTEADFSHGLCEECARKLYPEYFGRDKNQETSS